MTMSDESFVRGIRNDVIASNLQAYRELFTGTRPEDASDRYWKAALKLFGELDDSEREVLFSIMSQVMIDAVSSLFALFDGVSRLPGQDGVFDVRIDGTSIGACLQDKFLAAVEDGNA